MEQHPVPQNVTSFQFRLIGDMTIKQFGYLAVGAIAGFIFYKIPLPLFINYPLAIGVALLGFGLAFLPIEERPMDVWIMSFFRNVYSPTVFLWQKSPLHPDGASHDAEALRDKPEGQAPTQPVTMIQSQSTQSKTSPVSTMISQEAQGDSPPPVAAVHKIGPHVLVPSTNYQPSASPVSMQSDVNSPPLQLTAVSHGPNTPRWTSIEASATPQSPSSAQSAPMIHTVHGFDPFSWMRDLFRPKPKGMTVGGMMQDVSQKQTPTWPSVTDITRFRKAQDPEILQPVAADAAQPVLENIPEPQQNPVGASDTHIAELQKKLQEALSHKQTLEEKLAQLQRGTTRVIHGATVARTTTTTPTATPIGKMAPSPLTRTGALKLTTFPNIVTGIVKEGSGNLIAGVLVTVRDKDDMPLRALKTNKLGQFAASTQLPNGTYDIDVEDPRGIYTFDRAKITLDGSVLPTVEIMAKSQKELSRDKLAQELFGNQKI